MTCDPIARVIPPLTCSECLNFSQIMIFCSSRSGEFWRQQWFKLHCHQRATNLCLSFYCFPWKLCTLFTFNQTFCYEHFIFLTSILHSLHSTYLYTSWKGWFVDANKYLCMFFHFQPLLNNIDRTHAARINKCIGPQLSCEVLVKI